MFNLCAVQHRFPVKSSYLSLPLTPHISCSPTQPSVQFLPLSPTTPVHTSQSAHNIDYRRSYTNFVDTFANLQKRLLASSWPSVCLSLLLSARKNWAYKGWIFMKFDIWEFFVILFNPLNAELNPICHLLALLGGATIVVVSRLRVN